MPRSKRPDHADVVDLRQHRSEAAVGRYLAEVGHIVAGEAALFGQAKFTPFARSFIESGFAREMEPVIALVVRFRDDVLARPERTFTARLRRYGFAYAPGLRWAKGRRPNANPNQDPWGPELEKRVDLAVARGLFDGRENSEFGAYQRSSLGFRTAHVREWNDRGIGYSIVVGGHDDRRGRLAVEHHIVDDNRDMAELAHMAALIERAQFTSAR